MSVESRFDHESGHFFFSANLGDSAIIFMVGSRDPAIGKQRSLYAALALADLELEIEFVESLFSAELEFDAIERPPEHCLKENSFLLSGVSRNGAELLIDLPVEKLAANSGEFHVPDGLDWQGVSGCVTLSSINLSADERAAIQEGSILLLPESFNDEWRVELRLDQINHPLGGKLDHSGFEFYLSEHKPIGIGGVAENTSNSESEEVTVCVKQAIHLSPESLLTKSRSPLPDNVSKLSCQVVGKCGVIAEGVPVRIGAGYGLTITAGLQ